MSWPNPFSKKEKSDEHHVSPELQQEHDTHDIVSVSEPRVSDDSAKHIYGSKSLGVKRIEAISAEFTGLDKIILFSSIFLIAYVYGLDGTIRYAYQVSFV
jgi:SIT family siderophore-iron:H+ symporter-like MFS transporter